MEAAGPAVGIASLGIQVCQGLLSYYDGWKDYEADISHAHESVSDLSRTLILLKTSLGDDHLDVERKERVKRCIQSCEGALTKLSEKSEKLRKFGQPEGIQQKARAGLQRLRYPFRVSTLAKLRELVNDIRERLQLAVEALQLNTLTVLAKQTTTIEAVQLSDRFKRISTWISPPDPWTNHFSARQRHEAATGTWLLECDQYVRWKNGSLNHLWMYGKAGCGKTVLCSTAVEDVTAYCKTEVNTGHAVFYFSFSDDQKQTYENLIRSLVVQLGPREPSLTMLSRAYEKPNASAPTTGELEEILYSSIEAYDKTFLLLDALDECPEADDVLENMLRRLEGLAQHAPKLKILATSRELSDVRESMETLGAEQIAIATRAVDADIKKYVSSQLSHERRLARLDSSSKTDIEETITQKADGMFRWAYCQLQELKKLKCLRPSYVQKALHSLPATLDETYARMFTAIEEMYRKDALTLLRWLAYARRPPTLGELADAVLINPAQERVDLTDRGDIRDALTILSGLVTTVRNEPGFQDDGDAASYDTDEEDDGDAASYDSNREDDATGEASDNVAYNHGQTNTNTRVRLAHFSVKEYLESPRIRNTAAHTYHLDFAREHRFLTQSCLAYLEHYSKSSDKTSTKQDSVAFPLLKYAARSWFYHSSLQQHGPVSREASFLASESLRRDWLLVCQPDHDNFTSFYDNEDPEEPEEPGSGLYYACAIGLEAVVSMLLEQGAEINAQGGFYGNALQVASTKGHEQVVATLLRQGAEMNAHGGFYGNALQAASFRGYEQIVALLLERGVEINAQGGYFGYALQAASFRGYERIVEMLLERGAEVNVQGGYYGYALQAATLSSHERIVEMLLERGAEVNAQGGRYGNALQAASYGGYERIIAMLLERGVDVNAQGGLCGNALQTASFAGHEQVVAMLLERGANANAQGGFWGNALQAALSGGYKQVAAMLRERGAVEGNPEACT